MAMRRKPDQGDDIGTALRAVFAFILFHAKNETPWQGDPPKVDEVFIDDSLPFEEVYPVSISWTRDTVNVYGLITIIGESAGNGFAAKVEFLLVTGDTRLRQALTGVTSSVRADDWTKVRKYMA